MTREKKFIVLAPLSSLSKRTRLFKLVKFVQANYRFEIHHYAWERIPGESTEDQLDFEVHKKIIQRGGGYGGSKIKYKYFIWMFVSFFKCLRISKKDTVWALGFESAFPAMLASKIKGFKVIFDDADRFSLLFNFPKPIKKTIQFFERITSRKVFFHVIPGTERYDFESSRFFILKNMPSQSEIAKAREIFTGKMWGEGDVVVNVNGWLGGGRGMSTIFQSAKAVLGTNIKFIMVGKLDCDAAHEMAKLENVKYTGSVSNAEALSTYLSSDFVFTYYDPATVINTFAESNKWGDAIKIGIAIIVNKEVVTAGYLNDAGVTISLPYDDHISLTEKLMYFAEHQDELEALKNKTGDISNKYGYYEEQLKSLFNKISVD